MPRQGPDKAQQATSLSVLPLPSTAGSGASPLQAFTATSNTLEASERGSADPTEAQAPEVREAPEGVEAEHPDSTDPTTPDNELAAWLSSLMQVTSTAGQQPTRHPAGKGSAEEPSSLRKGHQGRQEARGVSDHRGVRALAEPTAQLPAFSPRSTPMERGGVAAKLADIGKSSADPKVAPAPDTISEHLSSKARFALEPAAQQKTPVDADTSRSRTPTLGLQGDAPMSRVSDFTALPTKEVQSAIQCEVNHPAFVPTFSARIATLVREGVEQARVHLNPVEMGPVTVQMSLDGQQVRVDLTAEQAATRQLLEKSMPSLAGALREAGFTLSGGGVFATSSDAMPTPRSDTNPDRSWAGNSGAENFQAGSNTSHNQGDGRRPSDTRDSHRHGQDDLHASESSFMEVEVGNAGVVRPRAETRLLDLFA